MTAHRTVPSTQLKMVYEGALRWSSRSGVGQPKPSGTTHSARITVSGAHDGCVDAIRKSVNPDKSGKSRVQLHDVGEAAAEYDQIGVQERWFRKGEPFLGKRFTVKMTVNRHATVIKILSRAAKRAAKVGNGELADAYRRLQAKVTPCRPRRRCGSSACPKCARAFQRAKVDAEQTAITALANARPNKHLVFVTIVPRG